jgi:magnesium chelatase family protein
MNPCPCGQFGSPDRTCSCPVGVPDRYLRRVSGPLRDRIDLWVRVDRVPPEVLLGGTPPEESSRVASRIAAARARQQVREASMAGEAATSSASPSACVGLTANARLQGRALRAACALDAPAQARAIVLAEREGLSGRGMDRLLRVSRTIADLAGDAVVAREHLDEAARFRAPVDRQALRQAG